MTEQTRAARAAGGRLAALDGLRLIAALMVLLFHFAGKTVSVEQIWSVSPQEAFPTLHHAAQYTWLGVELFFMISGFVICMSAWDRPVGRFARSRVIRLFPAYWPAVLITTAVVTIWPTVVKPKEPNQVLLNLTMLHLPFGVPSVDGVYWTLWAELRFYLLFALVVWWGLTLRRALLFGYGWLVLSAIATTSGERVLTTIFQPAFAPLFVAGIGFYLIYRFGHDLRLWGLVVLAFLIAQHNMVGRVAAAAKADIRGPLPLMPAQVLLLSFFLLLTAVALGWTNGVTAKWLTTAGLLTYPLYLLHEQIGWVIIHALHDRLPRPVVLVGTTVAMLLAAWLLHRLVEKPLARLLRRGLSRPLPGDRKPAEEPTPADGEPVYRFLPLGEARQPGDYRDFDVADIGRSNR